eukprot:TRINITY_DN61257_c0_g1_i1.p1 TRINITY_DN61257_c0_g1~~TRINITY_DN61257_c0_g1_i1.p1  ORF type:complete len:286 (-),score=19.05 TRINITY_DN61257_c0_g1_i1:579-1382(-)
MSIVNAHASGAAGPATAARAGSGLVTIQSPSLTVARRSRARAAQRDKKSLVVAASAAAAPSSLGRRRQRRKATRQRRPAFFPAAAPRQGILRKKGTWHGSKWWKRWKRCKFVLQRLFCCRRRLWYRKTVVVHECSRALDGGDTCPTGSILSLGLGPKVGVSVQPLATPRRTDLETLYRSDQERRKLLRQQMGDARFFRRWLSHKRATRVLQRERSDVMEEAQRGLAREPPDTQFYMPVSQREALARAEALAREVAASRTSCTRAAAL